MSKFLFRLPPLFKKEKKSGKQKTSLQLLLKDEEQRPTDLNTDVKQVEEYSLSISISSHK